MGNLLKLFENATGDDIVYARINQKGGDYFMPCDEYGNPTEDFDSRTAELDNVLGVFDSYGEPQMLSHKGDPESGPSENDVFNDGVYKMSLSNLKAAVEKSGIDTDFLEVGGGLSTVEDEYGEPSHDITDKYEDINSLIWDSDK